MVFAVFLMFSHQAFAKPLNYLHACWDKEVKPLQKKYLSISYNETRRSLYHSFEPWQTINRRINAIAAVTKGLFFKVDTLIGKKETYLSRTLLDNNTLLYQDFDDTTFQEVTRDDQQDEILNTARYSPSMLIDLFYSQNAPLDAASNAQFAVYTMTVHHARTSLFIRKADALPDHVDVLEADNLRGDALTTISYSNYATSQIPPIARIILISRLEGRVRDTVQITRSSIEKEVIPVLTKPAGFAFKDEPDSKKPEITLEDYNDHIHFVYFPSTDSRSTIVEFKDFQMVINAPETSENGELVLAQARKLAPNKPVRYFAFGHHHPDYLGGVRPFVHDGVKIIAYQDDLPYLQFLASAKRTLEPDSLSLAPRALDVRTFKDSTTITDGSLAITEYFVGKKTDHVFDCSIFYIPSEKLLLEDEFVWITKDAPMKKASSRQAGLYQSIKDLNLDVQTLLQSWPINGYKLKSTIPFTELEQSVMMK